MTLILRVALAITLFVHQKCLYSSVLAISYQPNHARGNSTNFLDNRNIPYDEQNLIREMLDSYDEAARPVFNASRSVVIIFSLSLIQISDMVI